MTTKSSSAQKGQKCYGQSTDDDGQKRDQSGVRGRVSRWVQRSLTCVWTEAVSSEVSLSYTNFCIKMPDDSIDERGWVVAREVIEKKENIYILKYVEKCSQDRSWPLGPAYSY